MTATKRGIYPASKTRHAPLWRAMRTEGVTIACTWIDIKSPGDEALQPEVWERAIREVVEASAVIVLHEPDETLNGQLVELGAALAAGIRVFWVGPRERCTHHPLVAFCSSLDEAVALALRETEAA